MNGKWFILIIKDKLRIKDSVDSKRLFLHMLFEKGTGTLHHIVSLVQSTQVNGKCFSTRQHFG